MRMQNDIFNYLLIIRKNVLSSLEKCHNLKPIWNHKFSSINYIYSDSKDWNQYTHTYYKFYISEWLYELKCLQIKKIKKICFIPV